MTAVTALSAPAAPKDVAPARGGDGGGRAFAPVLDALRRPERDEARPPATPPAATGTTLPPDGDALPDRDDVPSPALDLSKQIGLAKPEHPALSRPKHATCTWPGEDAAGETDETPPLAPPEMEAAPAAADAIEAQPLEAIVPPVVSVASGAATPPPEANLGAVASDLSRSSPISPTDKTSSDRARATEQAIVPPPVPPAQVPDVAVPPSAILPALQAFGAALHRAVTAERRQSARELSPDALVAALTPGSTTPAIAPAADAAIDTTQPHWLETMVSRIEQLRDAASAPGTLADTRIRLRPDALGTVDVTMRREGDGVHAHFTAAEPATARLLADAQPRLAELAQARGLRLTHAGVDGGAAHDPSGRSDHRQPAPARAPRIAASSPADDPTADDRLA